MDARVRAIPGEHLRFAAQSAKMHAQPFRVLKCPPVPMAHRFFVAADHGPA
jgi:hypothetical protein